MRRASLVWIVALAGVWLLLLLPVLACGSTDDAFRPGSARGGFPNTDIIYYAGAKLGFVNSDGSGVTTMPFKLLHTNFVDSWGSPLIAGERKMILVTFTGPPGYPGSIFAVQAGETAVACGWYGIVRFAADGTHILVDTGKQIEKYLLADCGTKNPPEKIYSGVLGALSPDEQYAAEAREETGSEPTLILHHIATGQERMIGVGDFPAWSRDGQWLAYTGADGIYLLQNGPNAESRRLIALESHQPDYVPVYQEDGINHYYPPIVSWSPDGQWLVYHVFSSDPVDSQAEYEAGYYSIFKVNVRTGETIKILDGGYSPSWRWPAEEP